MALNKLNYNSLNVTPSANQAIGFDSGADDLETGSGGGAMKFISKSTASSSATIDFTSGIDSTYKEYVFILNSIHPETDAAEFGFQVDTGTNTNYNITCTSTSFKVQQRQDDVVTGIGYETSMDQAQGTALQRLALNPDGSDASDNIAGILRIFNPSSSTFVKHFTGTFQYTYDGDSNEQYSFETFVAGYFNTTTALTRVRFKFESGNIDAGTITLYGIN